MKHHILIVCLFVLAAALTLHTALAEDTPSSTFFRKGVYYHISCTALDNSEEIEAYFHNDGYYCGINEALERIDGYYVILPDKSLLLDVHGVKFQLTPGKKSSYSGAMKDGGGSCTLTASRKKAFHALADQTDLFYLTEHHRADVSEWDYPIYTKVTKAGGIDPILYPTWTDTPACHLDEGVLVFVLGDYPLGEDCLWIEVDGVRCFANENDMESVPVKHAKVVRSSKQDKGRSVNLRSTPDYGDNVVDQVPYGKTVDVFPVVKGEFTQVYYDHRDGWITTVRLQIIDGE